MATKEAIKKIQDKAVEDHKGRTEDLYSKSAMLKMEIKSLQDEITNLNEIIVVHAKKIENLEYVIEQHKALISTMRGRMGV